MDLREKKTRKNIYNAFLELRSRKPLEKITIKELAETAEISKATFYLHYKDIYDLSEKLQHDIICKIIDLVPDANLFLEDTVLAYHTLQNAFISYQSIIGTLFSDSQEAILPVLIDEELRRVIFKQHPEYIEDAAINTKLSFIIMGSFYAYFYNRKKFSGNEVSSNIANLLNQII